MSATASQSGRKPRLRKPRLRKPRLRMPARWLLDGGRIAALAGLVICGILTPGFLSRVSLLSMMTAASLVGCVAVGMTFITLSGNVVSFSLGVTLSTTTIVFTSMLSLGLAPAVIVALLYSALLTAAQGWVIGYFRANPIIVSLAALSCITGAATWLTGGSGVYPTGNEANVLRGTIATVPIPVLACLATALVGQAILSYTVLGRRVMMVGSNRQAAEVVGAQPATTVTLAYAIAGIATGIAAVLMAARYRSGDLELGNGYDYEAISALLVGGTAIQGGAGSPLRTLLGAFGIAIIQALLVLWGFSTPTQYLAVGLLVLLAILLQTSRSGQ